MASKNDKAVERATKNIQNQLDKLDNSMNNMYKDTYTSRPDNNVQLDNISDDIYKTVNNILSNNADVQGIPNMTQLYTRLQRKTTTGSVKGDQIFNGMMDVFGDQQLINTLMTNPEINRYIKSRDLQIDMVIKYMPKLKEALDIKKDNVLSSDNFSKDFINVINDGTISKEKTALFASRVKELNKKYKIQDLFETMYDTASTYGEQFIYKVPYKKAFDRLMANQSKSMLNGTINIESSSVVIAESGRLTDDFALDKEEAGLSREIESTLKESNFGLTVTFNKSHVLSDPISNYNKATNIIKNHPTKSLYEAFVNECESTNEAGLDKIMDDNLDYDKLYDGANDGLININKKDKPKSKINEIPGCVLKKLKHENLVPIIVEDLCLGYFYLEFGCTEDIDRNRVVLNSTFDSVSKEDLKGGNDIILRYLANKVSQQIDTEFINVNNDLKDEIFVMLKYNDKFNIENSANNINVTYLPPEDVFHFYFQLDEDTHRGISDLDRALIPAMFWCLLDLSTTLGIVTRSSDKRIYYVKQNVEQNVARTMLNVINQLKKGNMGIRQMESMNNILGIIGKYNDHVIPLGPSGDPPIQFEVMQGQNIETPTDLLNKYEEMAVNSTDVPLEMVNTTMNVDYAIRFTMSNSKFLRKVFKRQFICEEKFSELYTCIYNYEYGENERNIHVQLPAPQFLTMTNTTQLLNNAKDYAKQLADIEYGEQPEEGKEAEKNEFMKLLLRHLLPSYIDIPTIDRLKSNAMINVAIQKEPEEDIR